MMHQIRVSFDCSVHGLLSISDYVEFIAINDLSLAEILLSMSDCFSVESVDNCAVGLLQTLLA